MKIPVLIYHDVVPRDALNDLGSRDRYYALETEKFVSHLKFLTENGFETICLGNSVDPNKKPVVITFDDGWKSNYECFKLLGECGFTATFSIVTNLVGNDGYLTWDQLDEMHEWGMNIQSHTCSHPILTEISLDQLRHEFAQSKYIIEERLKKQVDSISIPHGFVNNEVIDIAKDCGYKYILMSEPGVYNTASGPTVKRLSIYRNTTMSEFQRLANMSLYEVNKQKIYKKLLSIPKYILGDRNYHLLRLNILKIGK